MVYILCSTAEYNITDDGWIQFNGSQYYINTEHLDMDSARAFCKKNHSDLIVITGQTERKFIFKQVKDQTKCLWSILRMWILKLFIYH